VGGRALLAEQVEGDLAVAVGEEHVLAVTPALSDVAPQARNDDACSSRHRSIPPPATPNRNQERVTVPIELD